ncbi:MAG: aminodeoxychorismate/anthranilate synthase component II [Deltaproteobacteria bacterium]|nr:aminodeoxychorismate/anthranilate synthase component II [Deltaproteobacteria bacterium]
MAASTEGPRILVIDNYDSFTYNLVQYLGELGALVDVVRSDVETPQALLARRPDGVVISPGPGEPQAAGVSVPVVDLFARAGIPVLGVCLGHQGIGVAYGGKIVRARTLMHGKTSLVHHDGEGVFAGLPQPLEATRYHSLVIEAETCPAVLEVTARTQDGEIMAVRHRTLPVEGVQFHPESVLTPAGKQLLGNFLSRCRERRAA